MTHTETFLDFLKKEYNIDVEKGNLASALRYAYSRNKKKLVIPARPYGKVEEETEEETNTPNEKLRE